jgi:hypothetical protein
VCRLVDVSTTPPYGTSSRGYASPSVGLPVVPIDSQPPLGSRSTPVAWLVAIVAFAGLFSFVLPALSDSMIQSRPVESGEWFEIIGGALEGPQGWEVSVPEAAQGAPTLTRGGLEVTAFVGTWYGDTDDLLDRVHDWLVGTSLASAQVREQPALANRYREVWRVDLEGSRGAGAYFVVREEAAVGVVMVASDLDENWDDDVERELEAIVNGLWLYSVPLGSVEKAP